MFNASAHGQESMGGVIVDGELNVPMVLRKLGSVVAVENALTPATPPDVAAAAHRYIDTALELTTAAMQSGVSIAQLTRLTNVGNEAIYAFVGVCGLRH